jgi:hypothetical protein
VTAVTMTHPASNQEIQVAPSAVERYESQGWRKATPDAPKGNASLEDWQAFAREQGFTDEQIDGKTRDDLRAALS